MNESIDNEYEQWIQLVRDTDQVDELDARLQRHPNADDILMYFHRIHDQTLTLVMLAAQYGKDEMIRVMFSHSSDVKKLVELPGNSYRTNGTLTKNVTALWCACDRGSYTVARTLIELGGAKVEHGPRYPLIIDAVIAGRLDTVRFLVENNYASIDNAGNSSNNRLNNLTMAVIYGHTPIVAFLLEKGSKFDYTTPTSSNTPLGCAAIKGHLDIVRLLCTAGACPTLKNRSGQTPLMLAARYDRMHVVEYFLEHTQDVETDIHQLELVACSFILPLNSTGAVRSVQLQRMARLMRQAFEIRKMRNISKVIASPIAAYAFHRECQTIEEFESIQHDTDRLYIEALIIRERLLVPEKKDSLFKPLLVYGDKLVERGEYDLCLHLWEHTFYLYQNMDLETGLHRFVWLFCKMLGKNVPISSERFVQVARLTFEPSQQKQRDDYVKNALCFVAIAVKLLEQTTISPLERHIILQWIKDLCQQQRQTCRGQTLLHLALDRQTFFDINYRANDVKPILSFPNLSIAHVLLTYCHPWIDINDMEHTSGNTVLHISCQDDALHVVRFLIESGAHIDPMNINNQTPMDLAQSNEIRNFFKSKQTPLNLKCLCARMIVKNKMPYELIWSEVSRMNRFLFLHGAVTSPLRQEE